MIDKEWGLLLTLRRNDKSNNNRVKEIRITEIEFETEVEKEQQQEEHLISLSFSLLHNNINNNSNNEENNKNNDNNDKKNDNNDNNNNNNYKLKLEEGVHLGEIDLFNSTFKQLFSNENEIMSNEEKKIICCYFIRHCIKKIEFEIILFESLSVLLSIYQF